MAELHKLLTLRIGMNLTEDVASTSTIESFHSCLPKALPSDYAYAASTSTIESFHSCLPKALPSDYAYAPLVQ